MTDRKAVKKRPHLFPGLALAIGLVVLASFSLAAPATVTLVTVANMAALKSLPYTGQYPSVNVAGYYAPNDGGGGIFNWNSASSAPDNRGTVINPTGNSGAGRYIRQDAEALPYSVRWFGAKGDARSDDYAALTATITAVRSSSQRIVALAPGTYVLGTLPLDISGVNIEGSGAIASKIKRGNGVSGLYTVKLDGATDGGAARMTYRNFQIDGNSSANSNNNWALVLMGNTLNNVFENIQILNAKTGGLRIIKGGSDRPNVNTFINLQIRDGAGKGIEVAAGRNLHFIGLDIELVSDIALDISGSDEPVFRALVQNFWIEKTGPGDAVLIRGGSDLIALENGNIQDYGNMMGTQGNGVNVSFGRHVRLRAVDIAPRAGGSSPGHRKIAISRDSRAVVIEDHALNAGDIEDNSPRSQR
jgi:hypothetical protein